MLLRSAVHDELGAILDFWRAAAENESRPPNSPAAIAALHLRDPDALIVATDGDRIIGTIIAGWDGWRCHLYRLAVWASDSPPVAVVGRAAAGQGTLPLLTMVVGGPVLSSSPNVPGPDADNNRHNS